MCFRTCVRVNTHDIWRCVDSKKHFMVVCWSPHWEQGVLAHCMWSNKASRCIDIYVLKLHSNAHCEWAHRRTSVCARRGPCGHPPGHMNCGAVPPPYLHRLANTQTLEGILRVCEWLFHMHVAALASFPGAGPQGSSGEQGDGARVHFRPSECLYTRIHQSNVEGEASI